jgi:hypothetical protein
MPRPYPHAGGGPVGPSPKCSCDSNTPPAVKTIALRMLRLDINSKGRPFMNMFANLQIVEACRTRTSPMAMPSRTK